MTESGTSLRSFLLIRDIDLILRRVDSLFFVKKDRAEDVKAKEEQKQDGDFFPGREGQLVRRFVMQEIRDVSDGGRQHQYVCRRG